MPSAWEILQQVVSTTRHVADLQTEVKDVRQSLDAFKTQTLEKFQRVEVEIATLKAAQATTRETVRAEIATAVADLRVRYAEEVSRQQRPPLDEGKSEPK